MKKLEKIVIASHNQGKIDEIREMLAPLNISVVSAREMNLPDVEETGTTFEENACLKAETLCQMSGLPCLADDSGLCVEALDGRPGVYSARYAPNRDFVAGMKMLLQEMAESGNPNRKAYFASVLALCLPGEKCKIFEGRVDGEITEEMSGTKGFGYDPIFKPEGFDKTFGHFDAEEKAKISHRGRAFKKLMDYFNAEEKAKISHRGQAFKKLMDHLSRG